MSNGSCLTLIPTYLSQARYSPPYHLDSVLAADHPGGNTFLVEEEEAKNYSTTTLHSVGDLRVPPTTTRRFGPVLATSEGVILLVVLFFLLRLLHFYLWELRKWPPGPMPLPIVGNLHQIDPAYPHRSFVKWKSIYGPIFTLWAPRPSIVVADHAELQALLTKRNWPVYSDRPLTFLFGIFSHHKPGGNGIILSNGELWSQERARGHHILRQLASRDQRALLADHSAGDRDDDGQWAGSEYENGESLLLSSIYHHTRVMIEQLDDECRPPAGMVGEHGAFAITTSNPCIDLHDPLSFCFGNIINELVLDVCFPVGDAYFLRLKHLFDETLKMVASPTMLVVDSWPWLRHFLPTYHRYCRQGFELQRFFLQRVNERIRAAEEAAATTITATSTTRPNFLDLYLREHFVPSTARRSRRNSGMRIGEKEVADAYAGGISAAKKAAAAEELEKFRMTLVLDAGDLWAGGMETVVSTVSWAVIQLIHNPEIQAHLHDEFDRQLGTEAYEPTPTCRRRLPYFRAFVDELHRWINVLPWHIPHALAEDADFLGKRIAAHTPLLCQFGAVHLDPFIFPDPECFNPARFIDSESGDYRPAGCLQPFGLGRRRCLGEQLAKLELEVVIAALIQNFEFSATASGKGGEDKSGGLMLPSLERQAGMTNQPKRFVCAIRRRRNTADELILRGAP